MSLCYKSILQTVPKIETSISFAQTKRRERSEERKEGRERESVCVFMI
jgi:hypothetical protein